jgi:hypothetical protein
LRSGSSCAATSGYSTASEFVTDAWRPEQHGQPLLMPVRLATVVSQTWSRPSGQRHQYFFCDPKAIASPVIPSLRSGSSCAAIAGKSASFRPRIECSASCRSFEPALTILPAYEAGATPDSFSQRNYLSNQRDAKRGLGDRGSSSKPLTMNPLPSSG